jgi:hypothetical protein
MIIQKGSTIAALTAGVISQNPTVSSWVSPVVNSQITPEINLGFAIVLAITIASSLNHFKNNILKPKQI